MVETGGQGDANRRVFERMVAARPLLVGIGTAGSAIPGFAEDLILHAGPPILFERMAPPMRAAVAGALVHEAKAPDLASAEAMAAAGEVRFAPAHDFAAAGPMAGIVTRSMPVFIVEDEATGIRAFATINEGLGRALRFGANDEAVLARLAYVRDGLAPLLAEAIGAFGPVDLRGLVAEALRRGDECHNRNKAATALFLKTVAPSLVETGRPHAEIARAIRFIADNDHFFLNLSMTHAKVVAMAGAAGGEGGVVTVMAGNGVNVGIRVSGAGGRWFEAPATVPEMRLFPGATADDATPTMGDSYVTEAIGLGAFALAAAPAIAEFVGGRPGRLGEMSAKMYGITVGEHPEFVIPALDYRGVPVGIDVARVANSATPPIVNTGVASRRAGIGQIGAGVQTMPLAPFEAAAAALAARPEPVR